MRSQKRFQSEPAGIVKPFAGSVAPSGYLFAYGQAISRITYARLFAVIGTAFGVGDGVTTFNVPDFRGRVPLGKDNMGGASANRVTASHADTVGSAGGEEKHTPTTGETANHGHTYLNGGGGADTPYAGTASNNAYGNNPTSNAGSGNAFNVLQPSQTTNYIIKV